MPTVLPPEKSTNTPDEEKIKQQAITVIEQANAITITNQDSYNAACDLLTTRIKPMRKEWASYWEDIKKPMREAMNKVQAKFKDADDKLEAAEKKIKAEIVRFDNEQARIQEELQRKAQEEAQRIEDAKRTETAVELQDQGISEEEIEQFLEAPSTAIAAPVAPTYQRASGISKRENWKARVVNVKDLCKTIGAGKLKFAPSDEKKVAEFFEGLLSTRAKADKQTLNIAGVVAYNDPIVAGRAR
jgi:exonuclease VII large subunit